MRMIFRRAFRPALWHSQGAYIVSIVLVVLGILTPLRNEWWLFIGLAVAFFVTDKIWIKKPVLRA